VSEHGIVYMHPFNSSSYMETFTSYFVDSLFKHVLHSCDLCLVSTYKHEMDNCFFDFISY